MSNHTLTPSYEMMSDGDSGCAMVKVKSAKNWIEQLNKPEISHLKLNWTQNFNKLKGKWSGEKPKVWGQRNIWLCDF